MCIGICRHEKKAYWLTDWQCWPVLDLTACHCLHHFHFCPIHQLWLKKNFKRKDLFHGGAKWPLQFQLHLLLFLPMIFYSPYLGSNSRLNAWFVKTDFNCMHLVSISVSFSSLILAFEVVYHWNAFLIRPKPKLAEKVIFLFGQAETNTKTIWDLYFWPKQILELLKPSSVEYLYSRFKFWSNITLCSKLVYRLLQE